MDYIRPVRYCYNYILSASILGLQPGDSTFDYMLKRNVVGRRCVKMDINEPEKNYPYQISIEKVLGDKVIFNVNTGKISLECLGITSEKKKVRVIVDSNIRTIFNNMEYAIGEHSEKQQFIVPEVILNLEGI